MICPYCGNETEPELRYHERGDCPEDKDGTFRTTEILYEVDEKMEKEYNKFVEELKLLKTEERKQR